ncbi:unnamed protein product [Caenorhabditis brenneri]
MSTSELSSSGIRVSLQNVEIWQKFYPDNEMIVSRSGRKLFPELKVDIEGLAPDVHYNVLLHLERVGNYKYTFKKDKQSGISNWGEVFFEKEPFPIQKRKHMDGPMLGSHWTSSPVSFANIFITNNSSFDKNSKKNLIFLESMYKYQPVVTVQRLDNGCEEEFRLTMTEFMVVTVYQNSKIIDLKKNNNPMASRFQEGSSRGKKRAITSENTPPSTVATPIGIPATVSSPTKTVTPPYKKPMYSQNQMMTPSAVAMRPPMMATPTSLVSTNLTPSDKGTIGFQNQAFSKPSMSMNPNTTTPPSFTPTPSDPSFGGHNNFQNRMMNTSTMAAPHSMTSTYMTQPHWGSAGFQKPMMTQQTMTSPHMITPPAHDISMNENYNPYRNWNASQMGGAPMPPPTQWNTMPVANNLQNFAQFGKTNSMQQINYDFQQFTDSNGAGISSQQNWYGANYRFQ